MDREQYVVWITTRRIRDGTYEEFRKAWRPKEFPEGMLRAYECYSEDSNEVVGISTWDSFESRERYRLSEVEAARQRAMAPYVEAESSGLYLGRELEILDRSVPRAFLVKSTPEVIERLRGLLPRWTLAEEVLHPRPGPRRERVEE